MKKQILRLSPHQNGKVTGILMAIAVIPFMIPMFLATLLAVPPVDQNGNPIVFPSFLFLLFPFIYLIVGYVSIALVCFVYNYLVKYTGGFEFESGEKQEPQS